MATLKSPLPFSARFASSIEELVRTACSEEALLSTELAEQRFEKLQTLNLEYQEMKRSFDNLWNKCRERMTSTSEDISGVKDDVRDVKAATEELVHNVRMMNTETPIQLGESNLAELRVLASQTTSLKKSLEAKLETYDKNTIYTLNEIDSMRKDFQDVKAFTTELLSVVEKVRKIRDEDEAEATRYGTQSLDAIKESVTRSKETNNFLVNKLDECNEKMSTSKKDLNEVRQDLGEVKESADILVKVARNDDGATSIRLGLQSLDQMGKLDFECKKLKERLDVSLNECCQSMNDTKNDIGELKFITKTLMKEAEWTISGHRPRAETIAEIDKCIDKIRIVYSGSREVKESVVNNWRTCEQSMIDTENDIIALRKEVNDAKDSTEKLVCAKHVRASNDTKSTRIVEQNILQLKKLSSYKRDIKMFIENKLNKYNHDMMNTKNDILSMKEMINDIKLINAEVTLEVRVSTGKLDDEINNFGFDLARMEEYFPKELTKSREFSNLAVKKINEINEELNDIKNFSDEVAMMVTTVDDRTKCLQIGSDSLEELQKLLLDSTKMNNSYKSILDTCNLKLSNVLKEVLEVKATDEVLLLEAQHQDGEATSVRNIEESNIGRIKNMCSASSSMKEVVNKKLGEFNIDITYLKEIICKLNSKIVDIKAKISKILWLVREEKSENNKVIQLCNDKLNKISLLCSQTADIKESINIKMDICDKKNYEAKNDFIVSMNDMRNLKNELNEVKDEMKEVKKLKNKLMEDIKHQDKVQRIEWAISNIKSVVEDFQFKTCPLSVSTGKAPDRPMESHILLRKILMAFRDGAGLYLPDAVKNEEYPTSAQEETKKQELRDRISSQIKLLIGTRPTITRKDDGRFSIFYS